MSPSSAGIIAAGQASGFNPKSIPDLLAWISADYEATITANNTQLVTNLVDLSGNGNHTTAYTAAPTMRYTGGPGGGKYLDFNLGSGMRAQLPNLFSGKAAGELFAGVYSFGLPGNAAGFWTFGSSGLNNHHPYNGDGLVYEDFGSTTRKGGIADTPTLDATWRRVNIWSAPNDWTMRIDETAVHSTAVNTVGWRTDPLYGNTNGGGIYHAHLVLFGRKLNATERAQMVAWQQANPSGGLP